VIEKADKQKNSAFAEIFGNISESGPQIGKVIYSKMQDRRQG
jgi:hypothetical protein